MTNEPCTLYIPGCDRERGRRTEIRPDNKHKHSPTYSTDPAPVLLLRRLYSTLCFAIRPAISLHHRGKIADVSFVFYCFYLGMWLGPNAIYNKDCKFFKKLHNTAVNG